MSARPSEDELIVRYFAPLAGEGGLGLRDDAACFTPPAGCDLVVSTDALVAGVHFFADDPPGAIARKALRVNLSDLAAKGAAPLGFTLALALANEWTEAWLAAFADGLGDDCGAFGCPLLGGDTVKTHGPLTLSVTVLGAVASGRMVPRTGARPGDRIYVSGTIGDAALGLRLRQASPHDGAWIAALSDAEHDHLLDRYRLPQPRMALAAVLRDHAHAGMDVSDGLVGDLTKMLAVSGVSAQVDLFRVPMSAAARAAVRASETCFETSVTGGDDYEVLICVPPARSGTFESAAAEAGVAVTAIGEVTAGAGEPPTFLEAGGGRRMFSHRSYGHF